MALLPYQVALVAKQDSPYNVLPGTDISIRKVSDDTLVQIYADEAGLIPIAQPGAKTDSRGVFEFYTDSVPVVKAEWSDGVNSYSDVFNGNSLQALSGLTESSTLDESYRRVTTFTAVAAGGYKAGYKLEISDRAGAKFDVVSGGLAGFAIRSNGNNVIIKSGAVGLFGNIRGRID